MCVVSAIPRLLSRSQGQSAKVRKISPTQGLDFRTDQAVESRYTDYGTPIRKWMFNAIIIS